MGILKRGENPHSFKPADRYGQGKESEAENKI